MMRLAAVAAAPSVRIGEVPWPEAKVRFRPEPTTRSSPQRESATTTPSEVYASKQGRDARGHGQREPAATPPAANIPALTRDNHAVPGEDGGGG